VRLQLSGEHEYPVAPLSVPHLETGARRESVAASDAVTLFVERARAVKPDFALRAENVEAVVEICARLDGLPLALELAAARIKLLPPQALLPRLEQRLQLLTGGPRDLDERQRTLRNTIDWSYSLLPPDEQALFARLAVFVGGRTLEAAEAICSPGGDIDVLEAMTALLDNSLIRQEESEGDARFVMLETIHEYARGRLGDSGEEDDLSRRHAEYFLALAETAESELRGAEAASWLRRLNAERENLRAASDWAHATGQVDLELRLATPLVLFWVVAGHVSEGRAKIERLLGTQFENDELRARALLAFVRIANWQGDAARAKPAAAELVALRRRLENEGELARALHYAGAVAAVGQEYDASERLIQEAIDVARRAGNLEQMNEAMLNLGRLELERGNLDSARPLLEEVLAFARDRGHSLQVAIALANLGQLALEQDRFDDAEVTVAEALASSIELGYPDGIADALDERAILLIAAERPERAAVLFGATEAARAELGSAITPGDQRFRDRALAQLREQLGETRLSIGLAEGAAMTLDEAIEYAHG